MNITSTLSEKVNEEETEFKKKTFKVNDLNTLVALASRVITPLSPISTFAARHPWENLESQSFDQVADWLKRTRDVDIYPNTSVILSAKKRGEIDEVCLEMGLKHWLDSHSYHIPQEVAEQFCRASLKLDELPSDLLTSPEIKKLAEPLRHGTIKGLEKETIKPLSFYLQQKNGENFEKTLDQHTIKWSKLYLDESQTGWKMPNREQGFYKTWRELIPFDPSLTKEQRKKFKDWPKEADRAVEFALSAMKIPLHEWQNYLEGHFLSLPGWAGMMLWRSYQSNSDSSLLIDYLAVRLSMEWLFVTPYLPLPHRNFKKKSSIIPLIAAWFFWGNRTYETWTKLSVAEQKNYVTFAYDFNEQVRKKLWLEAWEQTYSDKLKKNIQLNTRRNEQRNPILAQFAFCIDTRSEPFRRHLEKEGPFETIGIAGFFGLPIATSELGSNHTHSSLPVMQKPKHKIIESSNPNDMTQFQQRKHVVDSVGHTFKIMKQNVLASLVLPEITGPWLSLKMIARSFLPRGAGHVIRRCLNHWLQKPETQLQLHDQRERDNEIPLGFSEEEQVEYVYQTLKMMGLTKNFSPLIVICGHGSQSTNNPYSAALQCGACGGAAGGFNARVLATLCNLPNIRKHLSAEGIHISEETVFVAAEHKTTVDELHWLYVPELSKSAQEAFQQIETVLPKVSHETSKERLSQIPNIKSRFNNPNAEAHRYAEDWSEIRPEWGLARNAAFIIGHRELTQNQDFEGRVFLHNYNWQQDKDSEILENIVAGPGTVAQWINLQYYASTVAPHYYGSGNKATQTVTAGLGVMQGTASDLLTGLPWQSVMESDDEVYHSPIRLLIVIQAPNDYIEKLLDRDDAFHQKVQNGWVRLASIDPKGKWKDWSIQD